jgi:hypothetical protein
VIYTRNKVIVCAALCGIILTACIGGGTQVQEPAEATINGIRNIDRVAGTAEFSVSATDQQGDLVTKGTISDTSATVEQSGFSASANVCDNGQIVNNGSLTAALTLDASGSMRDNDPDKKRADGAKLFVDRMSAGDKAAVFSFEGLLVENWTKGFISDKAQLYTTIDQASYIGSGTPLYDAAVVVISELKNETATNKVAVIFTDGEDTGSNNGPQDVINQAQAAKVRLFMIGLESTPGSIDVREMQDIASSTSGLYGSVLSSESLTDLFDNAFNASKASGCIGIGFNPIPIAGTTLSGKLNFKINNKGFSGLYTVTF